MKEALVNRIFNSFDLLFAHCCREISAFKFSTQEHLVLWLEVFIVNMQGRMTIQKLPLQRVTIVKAWEARLAGHFCKQQLLHRAAKISPVPFQLKLTVITNTAFYVTSKVSWQIYSCCIDLHWHNPSGCSGLIWTDRAGREMSWSLSCLQQTETHQHI